MKIILVLLILCALMACTLVVVGDGTSSVDRLANHCMVDGVRTYEGDCKCEVLLDGLFGCADD